MTFTVQQQTFEGPLDLLLQLIQKEELDITTIALSEVTEQYLIRVKELERKNIPEISDFLVVAARLLLLKSRALLADDTPEDEPVDDLAAQLAEYNVYKELAGMLEERLRDGLVSVGKNPAPFEPTARLVTDGVTLQDLHHAFKEVLQRIPAAPALPTEQLEEHITLEECVDRVRQQVSGAPRSFATLFADLKSRLAIIVTFLALLELVKQRLVSIRLADRLLTVAAR